ncbi:MAG TPA: histidine phosphatase family protein [Alphaproteobacteria bacterium]|nr:histidine phosphatase family protein [Alphaproteobacteria bacterium]
MKRLFVLRHAKSAWEDAGLADHDRPLAPRGKRAAAVMGRHILESAMMPDLILCSTARRATETRAVVVAQWGRNPPTEYDRGLYLTGKQGVIKRLAQVQDDRKAVMVVGHNPDLQRLVLRLGAKSDAQATRRIEEKFPTAALAVIDLPIDRWPEVSTATGRIVEYTTPRDLA